MKSSLLVAAVMLMFSAKVFSDDIFVKTGNRLSNDTEIKLISSDNSKTVK